MKGGREMERRGESDGDGEGEGEGKWKERGREIKKVNLRFINMQINQRGATHNQSIEYMSK